MVGAGMAGAGPGVTKVRTMCAATCTRARGSDDLMSQPGPDVILEVVLVNRMVRTLMRGGSRVAVRLYRWSGGRVGGRAVGRTPVLLLTVAGRKTGREHTTAVGYFEHLGGYVVVGSAGGQPHDPQWFKNLRVASEAGVEIGRRTFRADVRELHGQERDEVWRDVVLARTPAFGRYEEKTGRTMPLALLTPRT